MDRKVGWEEAFLAAGAAFLVGAMVGIWIDKVIEVGWKFYRFGK
jgi:hypothetical protein